jgi:hypothetical protein
MMTAATFTGGRWKFLRKPFSNDELHEVLSQLLSVSEK